MRLDDARLVSTDEDRREFASIGRPGRYAPDSCKWRGGRARFRSGHWDWRLAVRNITDKGDYASATSAGQIRVGELRMLVATAQYRF